MNEIIEKEIKIENMIYEIRGKQVMLDSDLAKLYQCANGTKDINKAVKRNLDRFPEDFYFQLNEDEVKKYCSRFQNGTLNKASKRGSNIKYLPHVFTQEGVAMLASVLRTNIASIVSIDIMRAFVAMRKFISNNLLEQRYINNLVFDHEERIKIMENTFSNFKTFSNELFFEGQIYDAHSLLLDILNTSEKEIIIIDNYISKELLDVLSKTCKQITIYTKHINNILINKYKSQYNNLIININNSFHDRFIIIDNKDLYHCGASFKDLGKKCFAINKIYNSNMIADIKNQLTKN